MGISFDISDLYSMRQALGIAVLRRAMKQDAQNVASIIKSIQESDAKSQELSVMPYKGRNIDYKV